MASTGIAAFFFPGHGPRLLFVIAILELAAAAARFPDDIEEEQGTNPSQHACNEDTK
jgi:hypothetical protein